MTGSQQGEDMNTRLLASTCLTALLAGFTGHGAWAQSYDGLYAFGDSLTDTGNTFDLIGVPPTENGYFDGRWSNGNMWIEDFAPLVLDGDGLDRSNNFAHGGAFTSESGLFDPLVGPTGLLSDRQVGRFVPAPRTGRYDDDDDDDDFEFDDDDDDGIEIDDDALVVVWAGADDYIFDLQSDPTVPVANLVQAITDLAAAGGDNFIVPNLPDLGAVPLVKLLFPDPTLLSQLTAGHNAALAQAVSQLRADLDVNILLFDVGAAFDQVLANPDAFGFTNTTGSCLDVNRNPTGACGKDFADADEFLFWDTLHPSRSAHALLAEFALAAVQATRKGVQSVAVEADVAMLAASAQIGAAKARLRAARNGEAGFSLIGNRFNAAGPMERSLAASTLGNHSSDDMLLGLTRSDGQVPLAANRLSFFVYGNDDSGDTDAASGRLGFSHDTAVMAGGVDYRVDDGLLVGVMFGTGDSAANLQHGAGGIALGSNALTVYGSLVRGGWYADATAGMSFDDYGAITRTTGSRLFPVARADTEGTTHFATLDGGYIFDAGAVSFGPTGGLRYSRTAIDGYREAGAGPLNLTVDDQLNESMIGSVGLRGESRLESGIGTVVSQFHLSYEHEFRDSDHRVGVSMAGAGAASLTADRADGDALKFDAALGVQFDENVLGVVDYDASIAPGGDDDHAVYARIKIGF